MSAQKKLAGKSPVRRAIIGGSLAVVAGVGSIATMAGTAFAAETPDTSSATSTSATATPGTAPVKGERGPGRDGVSTAVVQAADGAISTQVRAGGTVTEVSATSIAVKSTDGTITTFAVPATVDVSAIKVADTVHVRGGQVAGVNTATDVHTAPAAGEKPTGTPPTGTKPAETERPTVLHELSSGVNREGTAETSIMQNGVVTEVSATAITLKSADGYTASYTFEAGVTTTAKVGDTVGVMGSGTDGAYTAKRVATAAELAAIQAEGPRGKGGRGGAGAPAGAPTGDAAAAPAATSSTDTATTTQNGANVPDAASLVS